MRQPDVIGIGTSPLMLMRAIRLAESGRRVLLADRGAAVGGAWAAARMLGFDRVETGVHLVENRPALLRALEGDLGVPLAPDPCVSLLAGRPRPMGLLRAGFHAATAARALARGEADKARRGLRSAWRTAAGAGRPYRYPREGAWGLLEVLRARFEKAGGTVSHGLHVRRIRLERGAVACDTDAGQLRPELALISSRAWAPVMVDGRAAQFAIERGVCWNAVLRLTGARGAAFSYVEILGDPILKRVRDIGGFARPRPDQDERLLVVQYRHDQVLDDTALGRRLAERLADIGLLDAPGRLLGVARVDAHMATLTDATLAAVARRAGGRIETLATSDFADGFVSAAKRLTPAA